MALAIGTGIVTNTERRRDLRRSTRVPIRVHVDVQATGLSFEGETIVVNLHGALVKMSGQLELGAGIIIHVQLTGKSADARVVFASRQRSFEFGIALESRRTFGVFLSRQQIGPKISGPVGSIRLFSASCRTHPLKSKRGRTQKFCGDVPPFLTCDGNRLCSLGLQKVTNYFQKPLGIARRYNGIDADRNFCRTAAFFQHHNRKLWTNLLQRFRY